MGRPKAYEPHHFLKVLPDNEADALSKREIAELVGCNNMTANKSINKLLEDELIAKGTPTSTGAITYYKLSSRPDNWMPKIMDKQGKYWQFDTWIKGMCDAKSEYIRAARFKVAPWQVAYLWMVVLLDDEVNEPFSQANQLARANLIKEKAELTAALRMVNSILEDPFLSGNEDDVSMAYDAMRAMSEGITVEDVERVRDALK